MWSRLCIEDCMEHGHGEVFGTNFVVKKYTASFNKVGTKITSDVMAIV